MENIRRTLALTLALTLVSGALFAISVKNDTAKATAETEITTAPPVSGERRTGGLKSATIAAPSSNTPDGNITDNNLSPRETTDKSSDKEEEKEEEEKPSSDPYDRLLRTNFLLRSALRTWFNNAFPTGTWHQYKFYLFQKQYAEVCTKGGTQFIFVEITGPTDPKGAPSDWGGSSGTLRKLYTHLKPKKVNASYNPNAKNNVVQSYYWEQKDAANKWFRFFAIRRNCPNGI